MNEIALAAAPDGLKPEAQTLAASSRFNFSLQDGPESELAAEFHDDTILIYISRLIGKAIAANGTIISANGLKELVRRRLSKAGINGEDLKKVDLDGLKKEGSAFILPVVRSDGRNEIIRFYLSKDRPVMVLGERPVPVVESIDDIKENLIELKNIDSFLDIPHYNARWHRECGIHATLKDHLQEILSCLNRIADGSFSAESDYFDLMSLVKDEAMMHRDELESAILTHDLGKQKTGEIHGNGWAFPGHEDVSYDLLRERPISYKGKPISERVIMAAKYHDVHWKLDYSQPGEFEDIMQNMRKDFRGPEGDFRQAIEFVIAFSAIDTLGAFVESGHQGDLGSVKQFTDHFEKWWIEKHNPKNYQEIRGMMGDRPKFQGSPYAVALILAKHRDPITDEAIKEETKKSKGTTENDIRILKRAGLAIEDELGRYLIDPRISQKKLARMLDVLKEEYASGQIVKKSNSAETGFIVARLKEIDFFDADRISHILGLDIKEIKNAVNKVIEKSTLEEFRRIANAGVRDAEKKEAITKIIDRRLKKVRAQGFRERHIRELNAPAWKGNKFLIKPARRSVKKIPPKKGISQKKEILQKKEIQPKKEIPIRKDILPVEEIRLKEDILPKERILQEKEIQPKKEAPPRKGIPPKVAAIDKNAPAIVKRFAEGKEIVQSGLSVYFWKNEMPPMDRVSKMAKRYMLRCLASHLGKRISRLKAADFEVAVPRLGNQELSPMLSWAGEAFNVQRDEDRVEKILEYIGIIKTGTKGSLPDGSPSAREIKSAGKSIKEALDSSVDRREDGAAQDVIDAVLTREIEPKMEEAPTVIALHTGWIKGYEEANPKRYKSINNLIVAIRQFCDSRGMVFVNGDGEELAARIDKERRQNSKVVILAGERELREENAFVKFRNDKKVVLAGVDNSSLTEEDYQYIAEMLNLTLKIAFDQEADGKYPNISIKKDDLISNLFVFIPRAEPFVRDAIERYISQEKVFRAAA